MLIASVSACALAETFNMVANPGFETLESTIDGWPSPWPTTFGDWSGDLSEIVTIEKYDRMQKDKKSS